MMYLTPSANWFDHLWFVFEEFLYRLIACDNKSLMLERDGASLDFSCACVMVHPYLEIVTEVGLI